MMASKGFNRTDGMTDRTTKSQQHIRKTDLALRLRTYIANTFLKTIEEKVERELEVLTNEMSFFVDPTYQV